MRKAFRDGYEILSIGYSQFALLLAHNRIATIVACQLELEISN